MTARKLFVSGTDTGVGKTHVACAILRQLRAKGFEVCGFKPISCGDRDDARAMIEASGSGELDEVNPVWFDTPAAPMVARKLEGKDIDRRKIRSAFVSICDRYDWVVVEGAGGWEVPLSDSETFADLAVEFDAPVIVVAANRLGALNHILLTRNAIESRNLACAGVVLNDLDSGREGGDQRTAIETNRRSLEAILKETPVAVLGAGESALESDFLEMLCR